MTDYTLSENKVCASGGTLRKKFHHIAGRTIAIIDDSLVNRFSIDDDNTWFLQEATDRGILLHIYRENIADDQKHATKQTAT